jgi:hypothetical protein
MINNKKILPYIPKIESANIPMGFNLFWLYWIKSKRFYIIVYFYKKVINLIIYKRI